MSRKIYNIELDGNLIGTTKFEKADAPMGVAFGEINFIDSENYYEILLNYCKAKKILITDWSEDRFFQTHQTIESLRVYNPDRVEIKGVGNQLSVIEDDLYEISIQGIPYPFYEEEFPHHVKEQDDNLISVEN